VQTYEEVAMGIERERKKAVTFDIGIADESNLSHGLMTFYHDTKKKGGNIRLIKKRVCVCLREGKYEELSSLLKSYTDEDLGAFCEKYGLSVFGLAMTDRDIAQLKCLIDNIPSEIIYQKVFSKDNFSLLRVFLGGRKFADEDGRSDFETKELLAEKLKIIFEMGYVDINEFIRNNEDCKFMVERGLKLRA
jgi:hypothetical protein